MGTADVADLVRAAAGGDPRAWETLVDEFAGLVWQLARGHRLSPADAADVSQTVWLRLVESLPTLREPAALPGWLVTTTNRECVRLLRRSGREQPEPAALGVETAADPDGSPEAVAELREDVHLVRAAVDRLSSRCQQLLRVLAYAPEYSYQEVSRALGLPVGSIGPTRGRCLERLRRELLDEPVRGGR